MNGENSMENSIAENNVCVIFSSKTSEQEGGSYKKSESKHEGREVDSVIKEDLKLNEHKKTHTGGEKIRNYQCSVCFQRCSTKSSLQRHEMVHQHEKPYSCPVCPETFRWQYETNIHCQRMHGNEMHFSCLECGRKFKTKRGLKSHTIIHKGIKEFTCKLCEKSFFKKSYLERHMNIHTGEKNYNCHHCSKTFFDEYPLKRHLHTHSGERNYNCHHCSKTFFDKYQLKRHLHTHTRTQEKLYSCPFGPETLTSQNKANNHSQRNHGNEANFSCLECGKKLKTMTILKRHTMIHTGVKQFTCIVCEKRFLRREGLVEHMRIHGEKNYNCPQCSKAFVDKYRLKQHLHTHTRTPRQKKIYSCPVCSRICSSQIQVDIHNQRMHKNERTFSCLECGKKFKTKNDLKLHSIMHTGVKEFTCIECEKSFLRKSHLVRHMRIHTGEKIYNCPHCSKAFLYKSTLGNHLHIHTQEKP